MLRRGKLVIAVAALTALAACDALPGKPRPADRPLTAVQVSDFGALYAANCAGCHGIDGNLGAARPLNDPLYLALIDAAQVRAIVADGIPGTAQPAFAQRNGGMLSEAQIDIIARGIFERWARPDQMRGIALPSYSAAPGDGPRGAAAFKFYCARCHGADGSGSERGGSIVDAAYLALVSDQALRTAIIVGRIDLGMPDWRGYAVGQAMSEQEIADVVAFLRAHRETKSGARRSS